MKKIQVTESVAAILRKSTINENSLTLPGQLARPDYDVVMKVIDAAGGKWSKKDKFHVFPHDPRELFSEALGAGQITHLKQTFQAFYSPPAVAELVVSYANVDMSSRSVHRVLEPSAGNGAILKLLSNRTDKVAVEIDPTQEKGLVHLGISGLKVIIGDFLEMDSGELGVYDRIVMNPPFTNCLDVDHVTHAFSLLKSGGILVSVMSTSWEFRTTKKCQMFRNLVETSGSVVQRLDNAFMESGTNIKTVIVRLTK